MRACASKEAAGGARCAAGGAVCAAPMPEWPDSDDARAPREGSGLCARAARRGDGARRATGAAGDARGSGGGGGAWWCAAAGAACAASPPAGAPIDASTRCRISRFVSSGRPYLRNIASSCEHRSAVKASVQPREIARVHGDGTRTSSRLGIAAAEAARRGAEQARCGIPQAGLTRCAPAAAQRALTWQRVQSSRRSRLCRTPRRGRPRIALVSAPRRAFFCLRLRRLLRGSPRRWPRSAPS